METDCLNRKRSFPRAKILVIQSLLLVDTIASLKEGDTLWLWATDEIKAGTIVRPRFLKK